MNKEVTYNLQQFKDSPFRIETLSVTASELEKLNLIAEDFEQNPPQIKK